MVWEPEVEELRRRAALAARGGAPQRIERQHRLGRLTVRERIDGLLDAGSFHEVGALAGLGEYDDGELVDFTPASYVMGLGEIDGRTVAIGGEDFTIQGGSALFPMQRSKGGLGGFAEELAVEYKVPLILLIDGAGANVAATKKMGTTYLPNGGGTSFLTPIEAMQNVPRAGRRARGDRRRPGRARDDGPLERDDPRPVCDVRRRPTRRAARHRSRGDQRRARRLPRPRPRIGLHRQRSRRRAGRLPSDPDDALVPTRQRARVAARRPARPAPEGAAEALIDLVPRNTRRPYSMPQLIASIVDGGEFFELKPHWGTCVITAFARVDGLPIGIIANNPLKNAGALDRDGSDKQTHFIELCNYFHIPIVYLVDVPGFMIGRQAEREGTLRSGMRAIWVGLQATVPQMTIIIRKCYGMAGMATGNPNRLNYRIGWPSGEWGSIPIEGGVDAAYRREIANAPDPAAKREEIEADLRSLRSVFRTAETFGIEELIDPRETRSYLQAFVERAYKVLPYELAPKPLFGVRP